jgi:hypothetical protein
MAKGIRYKDTLAMPASTLYTLLYEKKEDWEKKAKKSYEASSDMDVKLTGKEGIAKLREISQAFAARRHERG